MPRAASRFGSTAGSGRAARQIAPAARAGLPRAPTARCKNPGDESIEKCGNIHGLASVGYCSHASTKRTYSISRRGGIKIRPRRFAGD